LMIRADKTSDMTRIVRANESPPVAAGVEEAAYGAVGPADDNKAFSGNRIKKEISAVRNSADVPGKKPLPSEDFLDIELKHRRIAIINTLKRVSLFMSEMHQTGNLQNRGSILC